jgi:hypothetical protein
MAERRVPKPFPAELPDHDPDELPADPDSEHVPPELAALEGKAVTVSGIDRETGELVELEGTVVTVPGLQTTGVGGRRTAAAGTSGWGRSGVPVRVRD